MLHMKQVFIQAIQSHSIYYNISSNLTLTVSHKGEVRWGKVWYNWLPKVSLITLAMLNNNATHLLRIKAQNCIYTDDM